MPTKTNIAQRALDCRKIRMLLAKRGPMTMERALKESGLKDETLFAKMEGMGIIEQVYNHKGPETWRVVPQ